MRRALLGLGLSLLAACSSSGSMGEGLAFGRQCSVNEDCASGLCVSTGPATAVCSVACSSDDHCPLAPNWGCVSPFDLSFRVCGCVATGTAEICGDGVDNDCDGAVDDCRVCDGVPVPANDPQHCGACNVACRADQTCAGGACVCAEAFELECNGACEDVRTSTVACGSCDVQCAAGQVCVDGGCVCSDPSSPDFCAGAGCVDFDTSDIHCGGCDIRCGVGQVCTGGSCVCPAGSPTTHCGASGCVDTETNADHCGECGESCDITGSVCAGGDCGCPAAAPDTCNGACVDNESDRDHCGACGNACPLAQACVDGTCSCPSATHTLCDGACVNPATNASHCGGCGQACDPGERCTSAGCVCDSQLYCGGVCVATSDAANCGACGNVCAVGQYCSGGTCTCNVGGLTACGDACVQTGTDTQNCGGCGTVCRATEICNGTCMCPAGQTWCDEAGACVNLSNRADHCGACGSQCPNGTTCQSGTCRCPAAAEVYCASVDGCVNPSSNAQHCSACDAACDNTEVCAVGSCRCPTASDTFCANENRCVSTSLDEQNCGTCGTTCRNTETCTSGNCLCAAQHTFCQQANACVRLSSSPQHCGACGNACAVDATCTSGVCTCNAVGLAQCGTTCVDLEADNSHCGACGNSCPADRTCAPGGCVCADTIAGQPTWLGGVVGRAEYWPVIVRLGDAYGVAWQDGSRVGYFQTFNADGSPRSALRSYGDGTNEQVFAVDLITNGSEFALGFRWRDTRVDYTYDLRVVRLDADGGVLSDTVFDVNSGSTSTILSLAWSPTLGYVFTANHFGILGVTATTPPTLTLLAQDILAMTTLDDGRLLLLLSSRRLRYASATGTLEPEQVYDAEPGVSHTGLPVLIYVDGAPTVVTQAFSYDRDELYIRIYRGDSLQHVTTVWTAPMTAGPSSLRGIAAAVVGEELFVAYTYSPVYNVSQSMVHVGRFGLPSDTAVPPTVMNPFTAQPSIPNESAHLPTLAMDGTDMLVVYARAEDAMFSDLWFRRFGTSECAP